MAPGTRPALQGDNSVIYSWQRWERALVLGAQGDAQDDLKSPRRPREGKPPAKSELMCTGKAAQDGFLLLAGLDQLCCTLCVLHSALCPRLSWWLLRTCHRDREEAECCMLQRLMEEKTDTRKVKRTKVLIVEQ